GMYIINAESGQLTRVPQPATDAAGAGRGGRGGGGGGFGGGGGMVFARDGRTLYFRTGQGLFAAPINPAAGPNAGGAAAAAGGGRGGRGGGAAAAPVAAPEPAATNATARHVTYTVNLEVDHKALRAQVFNEGWRIMKNRFYDAKMHGADWSGAWETYGSLLDHVVDEEELHTVMMMM